MVTWAYFLDNFDVLDVFDIRNECANGSKRTVSHHIQHSDKNDIYDCIWWYRCRATLPVVVMNDDWACKRS